MARIDAPQRLAALPGTKEFGRLSVMVQQLCDVRIAFTILGKSFVPAPDVRITSRSCLGFFAH